MKKHTKCRMNEICRRPHRDGECERNCYYNTLEVKTNADKLRSMSDEELANSKILCPYTAYDMDMCEKWITSGDTRDCAACALDWLKQESTDGNSR